MTVRLAIEIVSPLTPDDRDLLAGLAVMTLAIANRELGAPDSSELPEPNPCADIEWRITESGHQATGRVCVSEVGHKGRHKYRGINDFPGMPAKTEGMN